MNMLRTFTTVFFTILCSASISLETQVAARLAGLEIRALPNAPNGYTPTAVDCPSDRPAVRLANSLSPEEKDFLSARRQVTISAMRDFLQRISIAEFDVDNWFDTHPTDGDRPNIGIAVSGGGYRALMNGAGALQAFDSREGNSTATGHLGGLLQSATYVAGLSGGSWLVGSMFINNFTTISQLMAPESSTWNFQNSIFEGPEGGVQTLSTIEYFTTIYNEVQDKTKEYSTTITDYWGRAIAFQMINATDGGPSYTFSSIAQNDGFANGQQPFPIVIADSRSPGEQIISANSSVYEFNPYEFGTWDPTVYGFAPLEYIGGNFSNGTVPEDVSCVRGFDNAGYVIGTSSSLFNQFLLAINSTSAPQLLVDAIQSILQKISKADDDIAAYEPHPFYQWNPTGHNGVADVRQLTLVDGGSDLQNIPLHPLIQPVRAVDVIFAVDSSADTTYNWPNGTAMVATYERSLDLSGIANGTVFPSIPDVNTFVNLGLNTRPTFFGCDAENISSPTPLIVYLPNAPHSYYSNVSTFDPSYNVTERNSIILNGYLGATRVNGTADPEWPACVGCAILSRSFHRTQTTVPSQCQSCYTRYCWNGTLASDTPSNSYEPTPANSTKASSDTSIASTRCRTRFSLLVTAALLVMIVI